MSILRYVLPLLLFGLVSPTLAQEQPEPSAHHKVLRKDVGVWDAKMVIMIPGQDSMTVEGIERNRMLGGMWLVSEFRGEIGGQEFIGRGQFGYSEKDKKYVGTWIDNMEPYMSHMKGDWNADKKTFTYMSVGVDPATGKERKSKIESVYVDRNTRTMHMYMDAGNGEWVKSMEIAYKRRANPKRDGAKKKDAAKKDAAKTDTAK